MIERIIVAGFGGQGIILLGKVISQAALKENRAVTFMPSYGAEVRGGTAYCMVIISDLEIASPIITEADTLIVMNAPSLAKFKDRLTKHGLLVVNSSLAGKDLPQQQNVVAGQFSDIASGLGNIKVANMAALGAYLAKKKILSAKSVFEVIAEVAPPDKRDLIGINKQALQEGINLVKEVISDK